MRGARPWADGGAGRAGSWDAPLVITEATDSRRPSGPDAIDARREASMDRVPPGPRSPERCRNPAQFCACRGPLGTRQDGACARLARAYGAAEARAAPKAGAAALAGSESQRTQGHGRPRMGLWRAACLFDGRAVGGEGGADCRRQVSFRGAEVALGALGLLLFLDPFEAAGLGLWRECHCDATYRGLQCQTASAPPLTRSEMKCMPYTEFEPSRLPRSRFGAKGPVCQPSRHERAT